MKRNIMMMMVIMIIMIITTEKIIDGNINVDEEIIAVIDVEEEIIEEIDEDEIGKIIEEENAMMKITKKLIEEQKMSIHVILLLNPLMMNLKSIKTK